MVEKYTLWIVPQRSEAEELRSIMALRRDEPHSPTSYPTFEPHITLASVYFDSHVPLSAIRESVPTTQRVFEVKFESIEVGDHYFRSVYIAVQLGDALKELHRTVHERLGVVPRTPKYPHVSLVYISDEDAARGERERYYEELKKRNFVTTAQDGDHLGTTPIGSFLASEIWVMNCVGPVESWEVLDKIALTP